jgi:bifunctional oligoribonuclease and PAP phosphatase NrnA
VKVLAADVAAVCARMREREEAAVAVHSKPDLDCFAAAAAIVDLLGQLGSPATFYLDPSEALPRSGFFLDADEIVRAVPPAGQTLYVLDTGSFARVALPVDRWDGVVVNIDHHHDNTRFGDLVLVRDEASSTAEIVCDLARALDLKPALQAATGLYAGISFDSGHFRHQSTSAHTFDCAAWLVASGAQPTQIYAEMYEHRSLPGLRLWARAAANSIAVAGGRALIGTLTRADYAAAGADENETELIVESLRAIDGVDVAALVKEQSSGGRVRVSLRSEGLDVSAVAALRGGGGHRQAAGFSCDDDPREVTEWLSSVLAERLQTASS